MLKKITNYNYTTSTDFDFERLCALLYKGECALAIEQIKMLIPALNLENLPTEQYSYTRNIIINNKSCWLGLLNWDKNATTPIHGHPDFSFMYVIRGRLNYKNFAKDPFLELKNSALNEGEYLYNKGIKGKMDNYIHQISTQEKSLSLHFYSDDPNKGERF